MKVPVSFEAFQATLSSKGLPATKQSECVFFTRVEGKGRVEINTKGMFTVGAGTSLLNEITAHCNDAGWETHGTAKAWAYLKIKDLDTLDEAGVLSQFLELISHVQGMTTSRKATPKKSAEVVQLKPVATDDVKAKNLEMIKMAARRNKK
jgi:hypothetical protein